MRSFQINSGSQASRELGNTRPVVALNGSSLGECSTMMYSEAPEMLCGLPDYIPLSNSMWVSGF